MKAFYIYRLMLSPSQRRVARIFYRLVVPEMASSSPPLPRLLVFSIVLLCYYLALVLATALSTTVAILTDLIRSERVAGRELLFVPLEHYAFL